MKTKYKKITLKTYLQNFLKQILKEEIKIRNIEKNRITINFSNNIKKVAVIGVKVLKSYSLKDLYEMQFNFFRNTLGFLVYEIDKEHSHVYYRKPNDDILVSPGKNIYDMDNTYYTEIEGYQNIYEYINSVIEISLGIEFVLDNFPFKCYKYIVHYDNRDYLLELTAEIL